LKRRRRRLQRRQGGKTMKEEEQKFHNLNPWPYNLPLNLAFVRRVLTRGHVSKLLHTLRDRKGQAARTIYKKKCTKSKRRFLKKVTTWDKQPQMGIKY
jgi:hypothetical protein